MDTMRTHPAYVVCNRLIDPETWEHCEFDGIVSVGFDQAWRCPTCGRLRHGVTKVGPADD